MVYNKTIEKEQQRKQKGEINMKIEICKSYNVLGRENYPVYSTSPASDICDRITVELPDDLYAGKNRAGETLLSLGGATYTLGEVLTNHWDKPCLLWYDGRSYHQVKLPVVGEE